MNENWSFIFLRCVCNFVYNIYQVNGIDGSIPNDVDAKGTIEVKVNNVAQGVGELNFEEDEEEQFCMKDLPKHACS